MPWIRQTDTFDDDPDLDFMTTEAVALFWCANSWSARNLTDGFIPESRARRLFGYSDQAVQCLLTKCAPGKVPWWVQVEGGYQIRSFLKYNPTAAEVEESRAANNERVRNWREQQRKQREAKAATNTERTEEVQPHDREHDQEHERPNETGGVTALQTSERTDPSRIPYPNIPDPNTQSFQEGHATDAASRPNEPFDSVKAVLVKIADELGVPGPTADEVRPHLRASDPLRKLLDKLGEQDTVDLYVFVTEHKQLGLTWSQIWNQHTPLLAQMKNGVKWMERHGGAGASNGKKETPGADPDRRKPVEGVDYHIALIKGGDGAGNAGRFKIVAGKKTETPFDENAWRKDRGLAELANV